MAGGKWRAGNAARINKFQPSEIKIIFRIIKA
jgi:hypothetical protein